MHAHTHAHTHTHTHTRTHTHTHTHTHTPSTPQCVSGDAPHKDAAISCLDLLLRWVTLRFFDTNTTVNLKCLEFLAAAFQMLVHNEGYRMSDYEAGAFLPYLVQKVCRSVFHAELYPRTQAVRGWGERRMYDLGTRVHMYLKPRSARLA